MNGLRKAGFQKLKAVPGFTLVELLVVIAIMGILLALIAPAVMPLLRSVNINKAATMLGDELNTDRQLALTQNRDVEVRFYRVGSKTNANDLQFRAFRAFSTSGTSSIKAPLSAVKYLPEPVIFSGTATYSTLLDNSVQPAKDSLTQGKETLQGVGLIDYVSFLFRATGGTNLTPVTGNGSNWYLTFFLENAPINPVTGIPSNYVTAQIDPVTGRLRTYRP